MAIATVLFPTLARFASRGEIENLRATMANGMRQILFVLVPAAAAVLVLSTPMIRLVYQRGEFTPEQTALVATALFWFAFSLPTNGLYLLQTRTFFSLQRPWMATGLAGIDLVVSALGALLLYKPFGTGGIVAGTGIGTIAAVIAQAIVLRHEFGGLELRRLIQTTTKITIAAAALAAVSFGVWDVLDNALGRGLFGQIVSLGVGLGLGGLTYLADGEAAPDRRAGADHAAAAAALDARCRALSAGGSRAGGARRVCLARGGGVCAGGWCPSSTGPLAELATALLAIAGLLWVAELLGAVGWFKAGPYLAAVVVVGAGLRLVVGRTVGASLRLAGFFAW